MTKLSNVSRWRGDWTAACPLSRLEPLRGVAVLLPDGAQVALFRLADDSIRAVGNIDPIGRAAVLSRGICGVAGRTLVVNLPGSPGGVRDGLGVLADVLEHALDQIAGKDHS